MPDNQLGSGPLEPAMHDLMQGIATGLDSILNDEGKPKTVGWLLMTFRMGDESGRCNYVANVNRQDVIALLREQLAYFEGMPEQPPPSTLQ